MDIIGKKILNYKVVSLIGRGGMGAVYLAEHENIAGQRAAVKVINANMVNSFTRDLLQSEAKLLSTLHHQNIVSFLDYHIDDDGNIYLIMEYAEGDSLDSYINHKNGLIVEERICPLFEPILDGVGYAHSKGIVHRDIKPANVVVTTDGTPKILDFGIAKIVGKGGEGHNETMIMGTPSYMSPEQVRGEALDQRSDIYSLGVLLHQMLTGNAPYDTTTLTEQDINRKVVEEPLPRMRTYYKYVSDKVQAVVDKATAKNPDDRYQSCDEFKKALHRAIYPWRPSAWMKVAMVAAAALIIGSGCYIWDYNRTKVRYFKDYAEAWGIPQGIGKLSSSEHGHSHRSYMFTYRKHKLLSVKHVNSLGNVIDDGESERNERPIWQEFSYTDNNKVNRVIVKDRAGKVLYVKSYNDKLNTMVFQYDDEHGTERTIGNSTVGYGRLLETNEDNAGRISRWWLEYDKNGYVSSLRYAGMDNSPVHDDNGIYGRTYVRDDKGRPVEIHYIGANGNPQSTKWGLGIKKFYYDNNDNWIKAEYLTIDGQSSLDDDDGVAVFVLEHDKYGNVIGAYHQSADGNLMYPRKNNVAGIRTTYDNYGFAVRNVYLDADKNPMFVKDAGFAIVEQEYDNNGYLSRQSFLDPDGNPVESSQGNASRTFLNNEHGDVLETWIYDLDGKLVVDPNGIAGYEAQYDSVGNIIRMVYYGTDHEPVDISNGSFGSAYEYDDRNLLVRSIALGKDGKPAFNNNGIAIIVSEYDMRGNNTKVSFFGPDSVTPVLSNEGIAGWNDTYDDMGNHIRRDFFDLQGNPLMPSGLHYATVKYTYDENGYLTSYKYYNLNDALTAVDGTAGCEYVRDNRGNILEDKKIGSDGKLAHGWLILKNEYDSLNNKIMTSVYDASGAVTNSQKVHKYTYSYNSRNQLVEERRFDKAGSLTFCSEHWAIQKNQYDERGNLAVRKYFGPDEQPCKIDEGWSSATYEYNPYGKLVRQCFFGADGKPTDPKEMSPVGIAEYDKRGNMTLVASMDQQGNYICYPHEKWAIKRSEYDKRDNILSMSYFDANDKPVKCSDDYHKIVYTWDSHDRKLSEAFFGTDGKPILINNYHKETYKYEENSNSVAEYAFFGVSGSPVNTTGGFHRIVVSYNNDRTLATMRKFYLANGSLLATQKWNGSEWRTTTSGTASSNVDWQKEVKEINDNCPFDYGEENGHLTILYFRVTGEKECECRMKIPTVSVSDLSAEMMESIKGAVDQMCDGFNREFGNVPYVTVSLVDKNNKMIYSVRM